MKSNLKAAFSAAFALIAIAISFQNCGGEFKITGLDSKESASSTNTISSNDSADAVFNFEQVSLVPNQKLVISVELVTNANIQSVIIHSEDGSAKAGTDFEFVQRNLSKEEIAAGQFSLRLVTLYKETLLEDKDFTLVMNVAYKNGGTKNLTKTIQIKSLYQKMKYVKMFYGQNVMCGLSQDNNIYCWGSVGTGTEIALTNSFGYSEAQPVKILPADGQRIDIEKFQVSGGNFCFQQVGSKKVYCKEQLVADKAARTLKVNPDIFSLGDQEDNDWVLSYRSLLIVLTRIPNGNRLIYLKMTGNNNAPYMTGSTGVAYSKILGMGNSSSVYVADADDNIYHLFLQSANPIVTNTRLNIKGSDIVEINGQNIAILKDGRVGDLPFFTGTPPTGPIDFVARGLPESMVKWVGGTCMQSASGKVYCSKPPGEMGYDMVYDLNLNRDKSVGSMDRVHPTYTTLKGCGLNENFELRCRGLLNTYYVDSFNFTSNFADPTPKSKENIDTNFVTGRTSYDALTFKRDPTGSPDCSISNEGVVSCGTVNKRTPFANFKMRAETIKALSDNIEFFYVDSDLMIGQTLDGQWLISGFTYRSPSNWFNVYQRKPEFQNFVLGDE